MTYFSYSNHHLTIQYLGIFPASWLLNGRVRKIETLVVLLIERLQPAWWWTILSCHHLVTACNTEVFNSLNRKKIILPHKAQLKPNLEVSKRSGEPGTPDTTPSLRRNWWPVRAGQIGHQEIPPLMSSESRQGRLVHEVGDFWPFWQIYLVDLVTGSWSNSALF